MLLHKEFFSGQIPLTNKGEELKSVSNIEWYDEQLSRIGKKGFIYKGTRLTGDHYWFLNFFPINLNYIDKHGIVVDELGYPLFCQTDDWLFKQIEEAREERKGIFLMTGRGYGKTNIVISIGLKQFYFLDNFYGVISASGDAHADTTFKLYSDAIVNINKKHPTIGIDLITDSTQELRKGEYIYTTQEDGKIKKEAVKQGLMEKVVYGNRAGSTKGKRLHFQHWEEIGDWSGAATLKRCIMASEGTTKIGTYNKCMSFYTGTGGTILSTQAREIYNNPDAYRIFVPKEYDRRKAIFIPTDMKYGGTWEETGIPDIEKALVEIHKRREELKDDIEALSLNTQEYPLTEDEMFKLRGTNNFPQHLIATQIQRIETFKDVPKPKIGKLVPNDYKDLSKGVSFKEDKNGDCVVFEEPELSINGEGKKFSYPKQYIAGIDGINEGIKDTSSGEGSKFALVIKKTINPEKRLNSTTNKYVFRYLKRPNDIAEAYDQVMLALIWYDCKANIEFTKTGIIAHLDKYKQTNRLIKRPKLTWADGLSDKESKLIGTLATTKNWQFMLQFINEYIKEYYDHIEDLELLYQMRDFSYEQKGDYDLIAAMGMCEIACDEINQIEIPQIYNEIIKIGYYKDQYGNMKYGSIPIGLQEKNKHTFAQR